MGWHVVGAASHAFQAPRIVPYFSATVAGPLSQFTAGFQIASHLAELDAIATRAGVPSLSQYGFSDDHLGQPNRWHEPANAHHTVEALLRDAPDACRPDLQELAAAITRATAAKASFSLIIRLGSDRAISMYEMDLRKGKFL